MSSKEGGGKGGKEGGKIIPFVRVMREDTPVSSAGTPAIHENEEGTGGATVHDLANERRKKKRAARTRFNTEWPDGFGPSEYEQECQNHLFTEALRKRDTLEPQFALLGPHKWWNEKDMAQEIEAYMQSFMTMDTEDVLMRIFKITDREVAIKSAYCVALFRTMKLRYPNIF